MTDELAQIIQENFNKCRGRNGVSPKALATVIEGSDWLRKVKADAWEQGAAAVEQGFIDRREVVNPYL